MLYWGLCFLISVASRSRASASVSVIIYSRFAILLIIIDKRGLLEITGEIVRLSDCLIVRLLNCSIVILLYCLTLFWEVERIE